MTFFMASFLFFTQISWLFSLQVSSIFHPSVQKPSGQMDSFFLEALNSLVIYLESHCSKSTKKKNLLTFDTMDTEKKLKHLSHLLQQKSVSDFLNNPNLFRKKFHLNHLLSFIVPFKAKQWDFQHSHLHTIKYVCEKQIRQTVKSLEVLLHSYLRNKISYNDTFALELKETLPTLTKAIALGYQSKSFKENIQADLQNALPFLEYLSTETLLNFLHPQKNNCWRIIKERTQFLQKELFPYFFPQIFELSQKPELSLWTAELYNCVKNSENTTLSEIFRKRTLDLVNKQIILPQHALLTLLMHFPELFYSLSTQGELISELEKHCQDDIFSDILFLYLKICSSKTIHYHVPNKNFKKDSLITFVFEESNITYLDDLKISSKKTDAASTLDPNKNFFSKEIFQLETLDPTITLEINVEKSFYNTKQRLFDFFLREKTELFSKFLFQESEEESFFLDFSKQNEKNFEKCLPLFPESTDFLKKIFKLLSAKLPLLPQKLMVTLKPNPEKHKGKDLFASVEWTFKVQQKTQKISKKSQTMNASA